MLDVIYKIKNSQPTAVGEEAANFFSAIVTNPNWVVASSAVFGMDELIGHVNTFISGLAKIEIHGEELVTIQPIHVLYLDETHLQDGWTNMWGLLYSNGAVCYSEKANGTEPFLILFMDQSLVDPSQVVEIPLKTDDQ